MSEETKNNELTDEAVSEASGGAGFKRCDYAQMYESSFPERACKNCSHFSSESAGNESNKKLKMVCAYFKRTEYKNVDFWGLS